MIGMVAECAKHRIAVICSIKIDKASATVIYEGMGFDGKAWQSQCPKLRAHNVDEYIDNLIHHKQSELENKEQEEKDE